MYLRIFEHSSATTVFFWGYNIVESIFLYHWNRVNKFAYSWANNSNFPEFNQMFLTFINFQKLGMMVKIFGVPVMLIWPNNMASYLASIFGKELRWQWVTVLG